VALAQDEEENTGAENGVKYALGAVCGRAVSVGYVGDCGEEHTLRASWCTLAVRCVRKWEKRGKGGKLTARMGRRMFARDIAGEVEFSAVEVGRRGGRHTKEVYIEEDAVLV
jgi:hypothetical protein